MRLYLNKEILSRGRNKNFPTILLRGKGQIVDERGAKARNAAHVSARTAQIPALGKGDTWRQRRAQTKQAKAGANPFKTP